MYYHPLIGITIFILAIIISFFLGRKLINKKYKEIDKEEKVFLKRDKNSSFPTKGEITSPDAPWLKNKNGGN